MDSSCDAYLETSPSSIISIRSSCVVCKILAFVIAVAVSGSGFSASRCSQGFVFLFFWVFSFFLCSCRPCKLPADRVPVSCDGLGQFVT